jgi:branched-chain amino acid transport system substrate-binding protein
VVGDVKFGPGGEWAEAKMPQVQFQGIKDKTLDEFKDMNKLPVLYPAETKTGNVIYPTRRRSKQVNAAPRRG